MGVKPVTVTITRQTASVSRAGFGIPLIFAPTSKVDMLEEFSDPNDMLSEGYTEDSPAFKTAKVAKSQNPSIERFFVGKAPSEAMVVELTIELTNTADADVGKVVNCDIDGKSASYTVVASDTADDIAAGLETAISALTGIGASSAVAASVITLTASDPNVRFSVTGYDGGGDFFLSYQETTTTSGLATRLTELKDTNNSWYAVIPALKSSDDITAIAGWTESESKIACCTTHDTDCTDSNSTTSIAYALQAAGYDRTSLWFNPKGDDEDASGIAGRMLTTIPGSGTWAHKKISAVTVSNLKEGQYTALEGNHCNYYRNMGGSGSTWDGSAVSGEYIDTMRLVDWTEARVSESVLQLLKSLDKLPYTNEGVALVKDSIRVVLEQGVDNGGYVEGSITVSAPNAADIPVNDRANRTLPDVKFGAVIQGAIHQIAISGVVSL